MPSFIFRNPPIRKQFYYTFIDVKLRLKKVYVIHVRSFLFEVSTIENSGVSTSSQ